MESLNDKCEILMEHSFSPEVRDRTVTYQSTFTNLYTTMQSLVTKAEQCMSDHTDFNKAKLEFEDWFSVAHGTVQDYSNPSGSASVLKQRLDHLKGVSARMTEGQHLLNCTSESLAKVVATADSESLEEMKVTLAEMRKKLEQLNIDVSREVNAMKAAVERWDLYLASILEIDNWLNDTEENLKEIPNSRGQLGEMKTSLQRIKYSEEEIRKKKESMV